MLLSKQFVALRRCYGCTVVLCTDLGVVVASLIVLAVGSNGQVFATSAIRFVCLCVLCVYMFCVRSGSIVM